MRPKHPPYAIFWRCNFKISSYICASGNQNGTFEREIRYMNVLRQSVRCQSDVI